MTLLWLFACGLSEPEAAPPRVSPTVVSTAHNWVRTLANDKTHIYWANYDASSGRSARAIIERAPLAGGEAEVVAEMAHPPEHIAVHDGFLYWSYDRGSLKRVPVTGGEPTTLMSNSAPCFSVDDSGLYLISGVQVLRLNPETKKTTVLADKALADCPVAFGDRVYWVERKKLFSVSKEGGEVGELAALKGAEGLHVLDGALYTCYDDRITQIDVQSGETRPIRGMCKGEEVALSANAHWFRTPYFAGWPPQPYVRIVEVTSQGPSYLYDGLGASPPLRVGEGVYWVGRDRGVNDWSVFRAPLPGSEQ